jgi:hypothetical protein
LRAITASSVAGISHFLESEAVRKGFLGCGPEFALMPPGVVWFAELQTKIGLDHA